MMLHTELFSKDDLDSVHAASLQILDEIGIDLRHAAARRVLLSSGCREGEDGRVRIPPSLAERALEGVKGTIDLYGWDLSRNCTLDSNSFLCRPSDGLPYIHDAESGCRRPATMADATRVVRLLDSLDQFDIVNAVVSPPGCGVGIQNVRRFVAAIENSAKPTDITVSGPDEVRAVAEMARTIRGGQRELEERPLVMVYVSPISPLIFPEAEVEAISEVARAGLPLEILACPMLGLTAPVTIAGALAVHNAEHLAAIALVHSVRPDLPVCCCTRLAPTDMRAGTTCYGGPELGMATVAAAQMAHYYGLPVNGYGFGTSSKSPDQQCGYERFQSALLACIGGVNLMTGGGSLDDTLTTSVEQLVIDNELVGRLRYIRRGASVDGETLGMEAIRRGGLGDGFLCDEHTVRHLGGGDVWLPSISNREPYEIWAAGREDLVKRAARRAEELLAGAATPAFPADLSLEIATIVEEHAGAAVGP